MGGREREEQARRLGRRVSTAACGRSKWAFTVKRILFHIFIQCIWSGVFQVYHFLSLFCSINEVK